jgi:predicted N-acyltransferase
VGYQVQILEEIKSVPAAQWNALGAAPYPFLRHEFLHALEAEGCLGERFGWIPRHIVVYDNQQQLLAAVPLYLKYNSYGEFVFDWSWADAYQRNGLQYYPKLVSASPYTPANGPKLLLAPNAPLECREILFNTALELAQSMNSSSLHWLFTTDDETDFLAKHKMLRRLGCQFHWHNRGYANFADFLAELSSAKRKNIKRERRKVKEANINFRLLNGTEASETDWQDFHQLYQDTFLKHHGMPTLSLGFFQSIAKSMPQQVLLVQAMQQNQVVAAAFNLVGEHTLYGRHWGCREEFDSLHFEACYYQGIEFCIQHKLQCFEPGAQGEHKVSRGFLPTKTWSAHWIADARFAQAIGKFLEDETEGMHDYIDEINQHSPYRKIGP